MKLHILTAVWGDAFVDSFCNLTVRTLLAPGNLASVSQNHQTRYTIFTTSGDIPKFKSHPAFQRLAATVDIQFSPFSALTVNTGLSSSHWDLWKQGLEMAQGAGEIVITVAADHLFSQGSFARWMTLLEQGYHGIYCPGIQVVSETVGPELKSKLSDDGDAIDLNHDDFNQLVLRHLHPSNIIMMRDSPRATSHPEYQMRVMEGHGIAMRILASHAVCVDPNHFDLRDDFCPLDKIEDIAFEPCTFASAEPLMKNLREYYHGWKMDDAAISQFGRWMEVFSSPANRRESEITHFIDFKPTTHAIERKRADHASGAFVTQFNLSRSIYKLWRGLRDHGLGEAARWLATAHMYGRLRRTVALKAPATLFIPCDHALKAINATTLSNLLSDRAKGLRTIFCDHIAMSQGIPEGTRFIRIDDEGDTGLPLLSGRRVIATKDGGVRILRGPIKIDTFDVYVIDQPLTQETVSAAPAAACLFDGLVRISALFYRSARFLARQLEPLRAMVRPLAFSLRKRRASSGNATDPATDALRGLIALRSWQTLNEVFEFYQSRVLGNSGITSVPYLWATKNATDLQDEIQSGLDGFLNTYPSCAEANYERAVLLNKNGDLEGALDSYAQAACGKPMLAKGHRDVDIRVMAGLKQSRLLSMKGERQAAYEAIDALKGFDPLPWHYHFTRGRLLIAFNRPVEAMAAFNACLVFDRVVMSLPSLPKSPAALGLENFIPGDK